MRLLLLLLKVPKNSISQNIHYPYRVCTLEVEDDDKSVQCDLCDRWIHINCAEINHKKYEKTKKDGTLSMVLCRFCSQIPFSALSNKDFEDFLYSIFILYSSLQILQKVSKEIKKIMSRFKQVNQLFDQSENSISCDYYDVDDLNKIVINHCDLTVIHLIMSSLALHIGKLKLFLRLIKTKFHIICISESRIIKNNSLTTNINIPQQNLGQVARKCISQIRSPINCAMT